MIITDLVKISDNQGSDCGDCSRISNSAVSSGSGSCSNESENCTSSCVVSPSGNKYFLPISTAAKPFIGQVFQSLSEGYKFYKEYARLGGFNVRKTTEKTDENDIIILKHYVCSCEGFNDINVGKSERRSVSKRCGCRAKMVLKIKRPNQYFVLNFVEHHNHELVNKECQQFLKANREMTIGLRNILYDAAKVNIGCSKTFCFVKEMVGGYSNVGATLRDFRNFNRDLKVFVGEKDAQMIIDKFKVIQESSEAFYYAYDVDSDGHLTKLFWADAISRRNFELYGDAVSFDATFDTNKYNMIFAPFTGVDKHDRCVTFAACLLSHESVTDYTWAFCHFVKAMSRNPVVIVTDQCAAMKVAIPAAFSAANGQVPSKHRLCMWHIMEKFPVKLGNRLCKETDFMEKMKAYIWSSVIEIEEFERGWEAVIKEFNLEENKWLQDMYALRSSWIPAFFRDEPMFGLMRTTSRSESENFFFSQFHKQGDTLCEFWLRFQSAIDRQRNETARLDHESKSCIPTMLSKWFIEDDASDLFTRSIFYKIQEEILASCLEMQIKRMSDEIDGVTHMEIRDVRVKDKLFKVSVSRNNVVCSCKKFVMCGIVCRHSFCGLKQIGVTKFPRSLVLNRWMKIADCGTSSNLDVVTNDYFKMEQVSLKLTNIWFEFRQAVNKAGVHMDRLDHVHNTIKKLNTDLDDGDVVDFTKNDHMAAMVGQQPAGEVTILAPNICKNKGNYFKRLISDREKAMMKSNKRIRKCKTCGALTHDARTCTQKKQESAEGNKTSTKKRKAGTEGNRNCRKKSKEGTEENVARD